MQVSSVSHLTKVAEFNNSEFLKAHCSCLSDDHIHTLVIEVPYDDLSVIDLTIYAKAFSTRYDHSDISFKDRLNDWKHRFGLAFKVLFNGYIEVETSFEFQGVNQIDEYIEALQEAKYRLIENMKSEEDEIYPPITPKERKWFSLFNKNDN